MARPVDLNAESFDKEVLEEAVPVLVDFWSQTCPHCQRLNPDFEAAAESDEQGVKFCKVAAQEAMPLFKQHGVTAVPTLILFRDGSETARQSGYRTSEQILEWLKEQL